MMCDFSFRKDQAAATLRKIWQRRSNRPANNNPKNMEKMVVPFYDLFRARQVRYEMA